MGIDRAVVEDYWVLLQAKEELEVARVWAKSGGKGVRSYFALDVGCAFDARSL